LKVGHHGSRTSSSLELLAAVRPRLATISCGVRNPYGHPHAEALDRLQASRVSVFRLDRTGSVAWTTNGTSERIHVFGLPR
jgi:competence protein ComEC